jgi:putative spermidine/putrescine transport system ATP-binding protein
MPLPDVTRQPQAIESSELPNAPTQPPAVRLAGLTKRYGNVVAVDNLDLTVGKGELVAVLGSSGSGKTTLLRMIAGFESVSEGSIELFGRDVSRLSPADREIGMVFQNYALMPHLTVRRNIEYGLRMRGWARADRHQRVQEMMERMRLGKLGDRLPRQLSGGQQQRVAIARALAYSPKLLLMDEPMGALDKALKGELMAEVRRVHREFSTTIFYVTHDREEALTLADRVALMAEAHLVDCAPVEDMYLEPRTKLAAELFAGANLVPVELQRRTERGASVTFQGVTHDVSVSDPHATSMLAIRPRDTRLGKADHGWNVQGTVDDVVFLGDDIRVTVIAALANGDEVTLRLLMPIAQRQAVMVGKTVDVGFEAAAAHLVGD